MFYFYSGDNKINLILNLLKFLKKSILTKYALNTLSALKALPLTVSNTVVTKSQWVIPNLNGQSGKLRIFLKCLHFGFLFWSFFMVSGWRGVVGGAISGCGYKERRVWPCSFHHTHPKSKHNPQTLLSDCLGGSLEMLKAYS